MLNKNLLSGIVLVIVALVMGYFVGDSQGYQRAQADLKKLEQAAALNKAQAVAKAANPFQAVNPLKAVEANPFEKAKKVLNPFN